MEIIRDAEVIAETISMCNYDGCQGCDCDSSDTYEPYDD